MSSLRPWGILIKLPKDWNNEIFHSNKIVKELEKSGLNLATKDRLVNLLTRNTKLTNLFINTHKILIEIFINKYEISIFITILININIFTYR